MFAFASVPYRHIGAMPHVDCPQLSGTVQGQSPGARTVDLRWRLNEFPDEVDIVGFVFEQHGVHEIGQSASAGEVETDGRRCGRRGNVQLPGVSLSREVARRIPQRRGNTVASIDTVDIQVREPRQRQLKGWRHDGGTELRLRGGAVEPVTNRIERWDIAHGDRPLDEASLDDRVLAIHVLRAVDGANDLS